VLNREWILLRQSYGGRREFGFKIPIPLDPFYSKVAKGTKRLVLAHTIFPSFAKATEGTAKRLLFLPCHA
jgi:hypothetical protein